MNRYIRNLVSLGADVGQTVRPLKRSVFAMDGGSVQAMPDAHQALGREFPPAAGPLTGPDDRDIEHPAMAVSSPEARPSTPQEYPCVQSLVARVPGHTPSTPPGQANPDRRKGSKAAAETLDSYQRGAFLDAVDTAAQGQADPLSPVVHGRAPERRGRASGSGRSRETVIPASGDVPRRNTRRSEAPGQLPGSEPLQALPEASSGKSTDVVVDRVPEVGSLVLPAHGVVAPGRETATQSVLPQSLKLQGTSPDSAPRDITISIGRIIVTGAPASPTTRPAASSPRGVMSLDDYLAQRRPGDGA